MKAAGIAVRSSPIVEDPSLYVLKGTVAPAVLIEHGFHTNQEDVEKLRNSSYRQRLGRRRPVASWTTWALPMRKRTRRRRSRQRRKSGEWITSEGHHAGQQRRGPDAGPAADWKTVRRHAVPVSQKISSNITDEGRPVRPAPFLQEARRRAIQLAVHRQQLPHVHRGRRA